MRILLPLLALLLAAPAAAQREPEWRTAQEYDVLLRPWAYEPRLIRLPAGRPVRSISSTRAAPPWRSARRASSARRGCGRATRTSSRRGGLRLAPGERRSVDLVAPAGRYRAHSSNLIHRTLGMSAEIVVE